MEYLIEEVLYRDQRTFKSRIFEHHYLNPVHNQLHAEERASVPFSSLPFKNCQYQYCSKSKRLPYQTDVQCRFRGAEVCDNKGDRCKSWLKKFYKLLLLSIYLSLLTLPNVSAQPTRRTSMACVEDQSQPTLDPTSLIIVSRIAESAYNKADELKITFIERAPTHNLEQQFQKIEFEWLPKAPKDFVHHVSCKGLRQILPDLLNYTQIIHKSLEVMAKHHTGESVFHEIQSCRGLLSNLIEELKLTIPLHQQMEPINIEEYLPATFDETDKLTFDWLVVRSLVEVLQYSVKVFEHFNIPT